MGLTWRRGRKEPDPRRYSLPEKDCERLTRNEFNTLQMLLVLTSVARMDAETLKKRLECIPYGVQRYRIAVASIQAVFDDIVGTMTQAQARQMVLTLADNQVRMVPRMTPYTSNVVVTRDLIRELVDCAKAKCRDCTEDAVTCRNCKLYKMLEEVVPLDNYERTLLCPYALEKWE